MNRCAASVQNAADVRRDLALVEVLAHQLAAPHVGKAPLAIVAVCPHELDASSPLLLAAGRVEGGALGARRSAGGFTPIARPLTACRVSATASDRVTDLDILVGEGAPSVIDGKVFRPERISDAAAYGYPIGGRSVALHLLALQDASNDAFAGPVQTAAERGRDFGVVVIVALGVVHALLQDRHVRPDSAQTTVVQDARAVSKDKLSIRQILKCRACTAVNERRHRLGRHLLRLENVEDVPSRHRQGGGRGWLLRPLRGLSRRRRRPRADRRLRGCAGRSPLRRNQAIYRVRRSVAVLVASCRNLPDRARVSIMSFAVGSGSGTDRAAHDRDTESVRLPPAVNHAGSIANVARSLADRGGERLTRGAVPRAGVVALRVRLRTTRPKHEPKHHQQPHPVERTAGRAAQAKDQRPTAA